MHWTLGHQTGFHPWANNSFPTLIWSYSLIMYFIWMCFSVCLYMGFTSIWSLTPLPALGCVAMSKSQTFLWCGCRLLKFTGQVSDNWNRMVSEQGFYTQTQHNGQGWTKTLIHRENYTRTLQITHWLSEHAEFWEQHTTRKHTTLLHVTILLFKVCFKIKVQYSTNKIRVMWHYL